MKRGTQLKRTRGVRPKRPTPRRREAPRWTAEEWEAANHILNVRANGSCECCGLPLNGRAERHHRKRRREGGDRYSNILLLLPEHHAYITEHPAESKDNGWIVRPHEDPLDVPVFLAGSWWLLNDEGTREPITVKG